MIDKRAIFEIHRLKNLGWSERKIAANLRIDRGARLKKYLRHPETVIKQRPRVSKLDPFRDLVKELLEKDSTVSAPVVLQRLAENGWGHFGSLAYGDTRRKLYALVIIEAFSRMLYVCFTHSQKQSALHAGLLNAFAWFGGCPAELLVDNMATAVVERLGSVVRFNDAFLDFLRPFNIVPVACNPASPWEKGAGREQRGCYRRGSADHRGIGGRVCKVPRWAGGEGLFGRRSDGRPAAQHRL